MNDEPMTPEPMSSPQNSMNPLMIFGAIVLVTALGAGYFLFAKPPAQKEVVNDTAVVEETKTDTPVDKSSGEVKTFELTAGAFYYKPSVLRVKKGDRVKIIVKSVDMMHDFVIDDLNVKMPVVKSGETGEIEFVADRKGTFEFYCSVGQHRISGQSGTLTVEE